MNYFFHFAQTRGRHLQSQTSVNGFVMCRFFYAILLRSAVTLFFIFHIAGFIFLSFFPCVYFISSIYFSILLFFFLFIYLFLTACFCCHWFWEDGIPSELFSEKKNHYCSFDFLWLMILKFLNFNYDYTTNNPRSLFFICFSLVQLFFLNSAFYFFC